MHGIGTWHERYLSAVTGLFKGATDALRLILSSHLAVLPSCNLLNARIASDAVRG